MLAAIACKQQSLSAGLLVAQFNQQKFSVHKIVNPTILSQKSEKLSCRSFGSVSQLHIFQTLPYEVILSYQLAYLEI
jgi:hypothetical protein